MEKESEKRKELSDLEGHRYGNFMNYYSFHPAQERIQQLPEDIWACLHKNFEYNALDIGCNSGVNIIY